MSYPSGRHFLQIPGPTNVPDRVLRAIAVTVAGSQKGLMLPPGMSFNAISDKAIEASISAGLPKSYWDRQPILAARLGLDVVCEDEREHSGSLTAVLLRDGLVTCGHFNDLSLAGTLAGVQIGLQLADIPIHPTGVDVALELGRT